jgi:WD40 repeat protein
VIEATAGSELWRTTLQHPATSAAFSADGQRVVVGSGNVEAARAQLFDMAKRTQIFDFQPKEPEVRSVDISPDGRWVVVGGGFLGPTRVFKADGGAEPVVSINAPAPVMALGISDDGRRVATLGIDNTARVWDGDKEVAHLDEPATHAIALSADGRRIVVGGGSIDAGGTVKVFDRPGVGSARAAEQAPWTAVAQFTQPEPVLSVGISEDGRWVAAASGPQGGWLAAASGPQGGVTRMFEVGGKEAWVRRGESVNSITLSARAGLVATGGEDGFARVLELTTGKEVLPRLPVGGPVAGLRLVEQGRYLMAASRHEALQQRYDIVVLRQPLQTQELIAEACSRVTRNLATDEWAKYVGPEIPYRKTCPGRR